MKTDAEIHEKSCQFPKVKSVTAHFRKLYTGNMMFRCAKGANANGRRTLRPPPSAAKNGQSLKEGGFT